MKFLGVIRFIIGILVFRAGFKPVEPLAPNWVPNLRRPRATVI